MRQGMARPPGTTHGGDGSFMATGCGSSIGKLARSSAVHAVSALLVMGGWAAFANRMHGAGHALEAALVQGASSLSLTLVLKTSLEAMSRRLAGAPAFFAPPALACAVVLALLVTAHTLAGTPEVWATIAVPYAASSAYAWIYTAIVVSGRRAAA